MKREVLLEIKDLKVKFPVRKNVLTAVDGVNLTIKTGEIVGIVGESGSGKSVMSQSILRLSEHDSAITYEGEIIFEGKDLLKINAKELRHIRGNRIAVIFQDPMTSLSPVHTVERQMIEVLQLHKKMKKVEARRRCIELLKLTGVVNPENCIKKYPFELSGGMQQRVMIAMALACEPGLLIADEPTTALDVTIQEQILVLIKELNEKSGMAVLFITHDLEAMAQLCHSVRVMYLGNLVEEAKTDELFDKPLHPYTKGLLNCIPRLDSERGKPLPIIPGVVPPLSKVPKGCRFCTRCEEAKERCLKENPPIVRISDTHTVKCWKYVRENMEWKNNF